MTGANDIARTIDKQNDVALRSAKFSEDKACMLTVSVIIPVYNAPDRVENILQTLFRNTNFQIVKEIIIGDDDSDELTKSVIENYRHITEIIVIRNETNLGFLGNVNKLFRAATSDVIAIMNSDVEVPNGWAERVGRAFEADENLGLACPISNNATNLQILGSKGQHWSDIDSVLNGIEPVYPDCEPAVGFFLCVRKSVVSGRDLLDKCFDKGYWEDTDLHFRIKSLGYNVKIIDNLYVYHSHKSPSFSIDHNLQDIDQNNKKVFMRRWADEFDKMSHRSAVSKPLERLVLTDNLHFRFSTSRSRTIIFVLPAVIPGIGGINVVLEIVDALNRQGHGAAVYSYGPIDWNYVHKDWQTIPFTTIDEVINSSIEVSVVAATSWDSIPKALVLADHFKAKSWCIVQGLEAAFNLGKFAGQIEKDLRKFDKIVCVSDFLCKYIADLGLPSELITFGPSKYKFYTSDKIRRKNSIVACLRNDPLKGTGTTVVNLLAAQRAGFEIHIFGSNESWDLNQNAQAHGFLDTQGLRKLFQTTQYFIDMSYMEGLGLLPLEAAFCGCTPILHRLNGLSNIMSPIRDYIDLPHEVGNTQFFRNLKKLGRGDSHINNTELVNSTCFENGLNKLLGLLVSEFPDTPKGGPIVITDNQVVHSASPPDSNIEVIAQKVEIVELRRLLHDSRIEIVETERKFRSSTSWKLTYFIRWLGRVLGRG